MNMEEPGLVKVRCKYNHNSWKFKRDRDPEKDVCYSNVFVCTGIPCEPGYVTWTFFITKREHLIEVKDEL